jgi:uncharacterized protein (TIGR02466 family)
LADPATTALLHLPPARRAGDWIAASDVIPMFPTLVWKFQLEPELRDSINAGIIQVLDALRRDLPPLEAGRGWQSGQMLQQRAEFADLVSCIADGTRSILRFLRIGYEDFEITGCWATVLASGASHRVHSHPNNFLSGAYYVRTRPGARSINFHDPRSQAAVLRPPVTQLTAENTDQVVVEVSDGTLLLFPSYLEHSVDANASGEERISISFNVMFSSFAENLSKPLW